MKMTNLEMDNTINLLMYIQRSGTKLPARVGYAISRNIRKLKEACTEYTEKKESIAIKYGEQNEDGSIIIKKDNKEAVEEIGRMAQEIGGIEHEVEIMQISIDDFGNAELPANQMEAMMFMIAD